MSEQRGGLTKIDQLIKEYLVFRGFHGTLKSFETERRHDRNQGFQSVRIVERLFKHIKNFEYSKFLEFWEYLDYTFFTKYPPGRSSVKRLGNALKKFYVVNTILKGKKDKLKDFFSRYGNELAKEPEWRDWFVIPFLKNPEHHSVLEPYFNEQWAEMLTVSLQNFISTAVLAVEKPKLVTLERDIREKNMHVQKIIDRIQKQNESLKANLNQLNRYVHNLHVKYRIPNPKDGKIPQEPIGEPIKKKKGLHDQFSPGESNHTLITSVASATIRPSSLGKKTSPSNSIHEVRKPGSLPSNLGGGTKCSNVFIKRIFAGHKDNITSCLFSPMGSYLATSSLDETVRIWSVSQDLGRGNRITAIDLGSQALSLAWKKNTDKEKYLICGTNDGVLRLLDVNRKKIVSEVFVDQHFTQLSCITSSPVDNSVIVACQQTNNTRLGRLYGYNLISEEIDYFHRYPLETTVAETVNYSNDGKLFAIGGRDGTIRVYDTLQKKEIMKWTAHKHGTAVTSVHFVGDKSILSVGEDRNIHEWDIYIKGLANTTVSIPKNKSYGFKLNYKPKISLCKKEGVRNKAFVVNSPGCVFQKFQNTYIPTHSLLNPSASIRINNNNNNNNNTGTGTGGSGNEVGEGNVDEVGDDDDKFGNVVGGGGGGGNNLVQMVAVDWSPNGEFIAGGEKEVCLFQSSFDDFSDL